MNRVLVAAIVSLVAFDSYADTEEDPPLAVDAEVGALLTSGNTDSTALAAKLNIKQNLTNWRTNYIAEALYKEDDVEQITDGVATEDSQVTAERYFASAQADYKLNEEHRGLFLFGSYEEDKFSGYEYQASIAAGYSDRLFKSPYSYLDYSIGPGMSFSRTVETVDSNGNFVDNETEESAMLRVAIFYQYDFSENAKFTQSLSSDIALESGANTKSKSVSAVTANLNESFALKVSLSVMHNSEAPADLENTDTTTAVTLVYSF